MDVSHIQTNQSGQTEINSTRSIKSTNTDEMMMIKPYTLAQSIFMSVFASIGACIGSSLIGHQGPDHSGKQWQIVFCGLGGLALGTVTGDFVCRIWDRIAQK